MKREIVVENKPYRVEMAECKVGEAFSLKLNDETVEVSLEKEPDQNKPFSIKIRGKPYMVELSKIDEHAPFSVKVNDVPLKVELKSTSVKVYAPLSSPTAMLIQKPSKRMFEEGVVAAPMAGKIIVLKVKKGDAVKIGQVLCTLEAMKMENEITAPKNGVVDEVIAQEGKTVNEGEILITIK